MAIECGPSCTDRSRPARNGGQFGPVETKPSLWRAIRWPMALLGVAVVGVATALLLDETSAREYALVIGAPSLTILLPAALIWLAAAAIIHIVRRR
jgi:hypothetical protein